MTTNKMNPKVDAYLGRAKKWQAEMEKLRSIVLECPVTEELKWGKPCYTFNDKNVVLIIGFKNYCSLLFAKGALLKDPKKILIRPGENTQAARQIRFTDVREIDRKRGILKAYVQEAIEAEKAGLEVKYKKPAEFKIPEELQKKFKQMPALKTAFEALTPGRQRAYNMHFSQPKQTQTRESRIEKCIPQILKGEGLNEQYRTKK